MSTPPDEKLERLRKDTRTDFFKSSGPGGQRKNKRETAVRITHLPTGVVVIATESRSQAANTISAQKRLIEKLEKLNRKKKKRIPTAIPSAVDRARRENKKKRAIVKQMRREPSAE